MGVEQIILIVHVLAAIGIIALILIQQGKGADMGASFGSGASQTIFGSEGSGNFLTKSTSLLAALFFATSFGLAIIAKDKATAIVGADLPAVEAMEVQQATVDAGNEIPVLDSSESSANPADDIPANDAGDNIPE